MPFLARLLTGERSLTPQRDARLARLLPGLVALSLVALTTCAAADAAAQDPGAPLVREIELSGTIDPATASWVEEALGEAERDDAALAIIRLDTPGGLDASMRDIVQAITGSRLPVVVHVTPSGARAASAGLFIVQAADVAVMAPGTNIGAASPVTLGGEGPDEVLGRKIENDAAAYVRALAETHGREPDLAEEMVREAVSVTAQRALDARLIDLVSDRASLLERLDGFAVQGPKAQTLATTGLSVEVREMPWRVEARQALVNPTVSYLLLLGGVLLVGFELLSPGLIGPGLFGTVALLLGLYGTAQLPVTLAGAVLLLLGLVFLLAETQVASGLLGIAGTLAVIAGGLLLYDTDSEVLRLSLPAVVGSALAMGAFFLFAARKALAVRRRPARGDLREDLVGKRATVRTPLEPAGQVYLHGARWRARTTSGESVQHGRTVVVEGVDGLTLLVAPSAEATSHPKESR